MDQLRMNQVNSQKKMILIPISSFIQGLLGSAFLGFEK